MGTGITYSAPLCRSADNSASVRCAIRQPTVPFLKSRAISSFVSSASSASSKATRSDGGPPRLSIFEFANARYEPLSVAIPLAAGGRPSVVEIDQARSPT